MDEKICDQAMELRITRPNGALMSQHVISKFGPRMPIGTLFVENGRLVLKAVMMDTGEPELTGGLVQPGVPWVGDMNFAVVPANI